MGKLFEASPASHSPGAAQRRGWFSSIAADRSPRMVALRELLNGWFAAYAASAPGNDLRARFRSGDDAQHFAAFFELYCHALLQSHGLDVEIHPLIDPERGTRPDFRTWQGGQPTMVIESTTVPGSRDSTSEAKRLAQARDHLNRLQPKDFVVTMKVKSVGTSSLPTGRVRSWLQRHLHNLPRDQVATVDLSASPPEREEWTWNEDGWHLVFSPMLRPAALTDSADVIWFDYRLGWGDPWGQLPGVLQGKVSKYGRLDLAYVIAIDDVQPDNGLGDLEVGAALFGSGARIGSDPIPFDPRAFRTGSHAGLWYGPAGPRNQHVSGVVFVSQLVATEICRRTPVLWENPWAAHPIGPSLWAGPRRRLQHDRIELVPGCSAPEVLGLVEWCRDSRCDQ